MTFEELALGWLGGAIGLLLATQAAIGGSKKPNEAAHLYVQGVWLLITLCFWILT